MQAVTGKETPMKHGPPTATRGPAAKSGLKSSLLPALTAVDTGPPIGGSALTSGANVDPLLVPGSAVVSTGD